MLGRRTRLVSASLVRFDDAARLEARRLAEACHALGVLLVLDVSQCVGAQCLKKNGQACTGDAQCVSGKCCGNVCVDVNTSTSQTCTNGACS